ncbi:hypothetical protein CF386_11870 [Paraphotobacterium marinum]|uniref:MaoC-like domain-containing protein n=1 Tax=Paraphotobacterium marinum TaxID=1755811 RepID=A0A220VIE8_9GAMM|nr:MaoC/PaaZ C-terminal domain-containing protein [Paraphotobacterium marinum]ASK79733.1 hypothetical protein CF386_11870 [Paraphotobacterium marinum]
MRVPKLLIFNHIEAAKTIASITTKKMLKTSYSRAPFITHLKKEVRTPSKSLIFHYSNWVSASQNKYKDRIPPHLFCQYALPICIRQIAQTSYNLKTIINQGCKLTVYQDIPCQTKLLLKVKIVEIEQTSKHALIHQVIYVHTKSRKLALKVDIYSKFLLSRSRSITRNPTKLDDFDTICQWDISEQDGLNFAFLTGDFNPLHWLDPVAKKSIFKGKVLHGFGVFAKIYEQIELFNKTQIKSVDVKFVRPAKIPSQDLQLLQEKTDSKVKSICLKDKNNKVLLIGNVNLQ